MRVSVTVVAGLGGAGKTRLIDQWRATAPAPWALIIDRGEEFKFPRATGSDSPADSSAIDPAVERIGGCVCCTASAALASGLRRLLRRGPWAHLLIELNGGAHLPAFIDVLRAPGLATALHLSEVVSVIDANRLPTRLAGPQRAWLVEQVQSADRVLLRYPSTMSRSESDRWAREVAALGGSGSFAAHVHPWRDEDPPPAATHVFEPRDASGSGDRARVSPQAVLVAPAADDSPIRWQWVWRAEPSRVFDRVALIAAFEALSRDWQAGARPEGTDGCATPGSEPAASARLKPAIEAVLRTERDWYGHRDGQWEPALWRRDSRVQVEIQADRLATLRGPLAEFADRLRRSEKHS